MQRALLIAPVLVLGLAVTAVAGQSTKPVSQWTCQEFLAVDGQFQPKVIYSASMLTKQGKPEDTVIDVDGTEKVIPIVISECKKTPKASFWTKVKDAWATVEAEAKAAAKKVEKKF